MTWEHAERLLGCSDGQAAGWAPALFGALVGSRGCETLMVELEVSRWVVWWVGMTHDRVVGCWCVHSGAQKQCEHGAWWACEWEVVRGEMHVVCWRKESNRGPQIGW